MAPIRNPRKKEGRGKVSEMTGTRSSAAFEASSVSLLSASSEEFFPWGRLPRELQIKVLQNLTRPELDKYRFLNREMFELIRCSEQLMKRKLIEYLQIRMDTFKCVLVPVKFRSVFLFTRFSEDGIASSSLKGPSPSSLFTMTSPHSSNGPLPTQCDLAMNCLISDLHPLSTSNRLLEIVKNANVHRLEITEEHLTDQDLWLMSACLLEAGCSVHALSITKVLMRFVTPDQLLLFLRNVAPKEIYFDKVHFGSSFSVEVLEFIVTRPHFGVISSRRESIIPIDDDILHKITATNFYIGAPNKITIAGLESFVESVACGKRNVIYAEIHTRFRLARVPSLSTSADLDLKLLDKGKGIVISSRSESSEMT